MLLIEDAAGPTSIAGVMGGARSEVNDATTRVLMEAANWNGPNIQRTSSRLTLRTEASGRFEKGLSPELCLEGQALAAQLMVELCGARVVGGTIDVGGPGPEAAVLRLREARVGALLGVEIPRDEQARILERLGFGVAEADDGLDVTRAPLAAPRRHPRGRPGRGGRADLGLREAPDHAAVAQRGQRPARAGAAAAAAGRGRADRRGRLRDPRLELRRAGAGGEAVDPAGRPARAGGGARQSDVGGPVGAAHVAARAAARQRRAEPRPGARGRAAVAVRGHLPRARGRRGQRGGAAGGAGARPPAHRAPAPRRAVDRQPPPARRGASRRRRARTSSPRRACSPR